MRGLVAHNARFAAVNLDPSMGRPEFPDAVQALTEDDQLRTAFLRACLVKLGLQVNEEQNAVPSLSRIHVTSLQPSDISKLHDSLKDIIVSENGEEYIKDENDTFHIEKPSAWTLASLNDAITEPADAKTDENDGAEDRILDYSAVIKRLVLHDGDYPTSKETPYFNHHAYFANLKQYQSASRAANPDFGRNLLYGEVVTSTNTMLEK
jgi:biotin--protein ligase